MADPLLYGSYVDYLMFAHERTLKPGTSTCKQNTPPGLPPRLLPVTYNWSNLLPTKQRLLVHCCAPSYVASNLPSADTV